MKKVFIVLAGFLLSSFWIFAQEYQPYLSQEEVMSSVRLLPPPPQEGSIEFALDTVAYREYYKLRTVNPERAAQAIADADMSDIGHKFEEAFGLLVTKETMPETWLLLARSRECFGSSGSNEAKQYYKRQRPFDYFGSCTLTPDDDEWLRANYSYPSGHTANYWGLAYILAELRPECSEAILQRAEQGGISRLIVGAHWASDVAAGRMVAASVFQYLKDNPEYQAQFKKAKQEVQNELAKQEGIVAANVAEFQTPEVDLKKLAPALKYKTVKKQEMLDLLLKYLAVNSGSIPTKEPEPMTPGQEEMARLLKSDADALGANVFLSEWNYVYIDIPSNLKYDVPVLGISCHLDYNTETYGPITWDKLPAIHPIVIDEYKGGDIEQAPGRYIRVNSAEGADLPGLVGTTLIHTDGTTVLGGDDKNGCAIVMSLVKTILQKGVKHGHIQVVIAPNEDIGKAQLHIDSTYFNPDILFDVDGGGGNKIMASNFTARAFDVAFLGHDAYPGEAKALKFGDSYAASCEYTASIPLMYRPESTEGFEGYIHPHEPLIEKVKDENGDEQIQYTVKSRIRFFDPMEGEEFDRLLKEILAKVKADFPNVQISIVTDETTYENVSLSMNPLSYTVLSRAAARLKQDIEYIPVRAGTTAAMFAAKGITAGMCLFSGQHNDHTPKEYSCLEEMMDAYKLLLYAVDEVSQLKSSTR